MKVDSIAFSGQREKTCQEEKESRDRPWIFFLVFCCSSTMLVLWFRFHRFASGVRPPFRSLPKNGATIFVCPYISVACVQLTVFTSSRQATNSLKPSAYLCLVLEGGPYPFPVVPLLRRRFGIFGFFPVICNYRSHLPVIDWPTTRALAWIIQRSAGLSPRLYVCFLGGFLFSHFPLIIASRSLL